MATMFKLSVLWIVVSTVYLYITHYLDKQTKTIVVRINVVGSTSHGPEDLQVLYESICAGDFHSPITPFT